MYVGVWLCTNVPDNYIHNVSFFPKVILYPNSFEKKTVHVSHKNGK